VTSHFKFALRSLLKTPGVSLISIITLALGAGACVAMFTLLNSSLLRPLSFAAPDQLYKLQRVWDRSRSDGFAPADVLDLQESLRGRGAAAGFAFSSVSLANAGSPPEWQNSIRVSPNFFDVLGVKPLLGRTFLPNEDTLGNHRVLVLTYPLWQERFAGDKDIVGKLARVDGEIWQIVGVLPETAHETRVFGNARLFRPLALSESERSNRDMQWVNMIYRRDAKSSARHSKAIIESIGSQIAKNHPNEKNVRWQAEGLRESSMKPSARALVTMLIGLGCVVLLVACSNLANLLLARAMGRAREFAVRGALGASKIQLILPLSLESLFLSLCGSAGALLVSRWICDWLRAQVMASGDTIFKTPLDWRVLAFTMALSLVTALAFCIAPALFVTNASLQETLKANSRGASTMPRHHIFRSALVVAQFALTLPLLAGAGFFIRGAHNALAEPNGWSADQVVQGTLFLPKDYRPDKDLNQFYADLQQRLETIPGAEAASISYELPFRGLGNDRQYVVEGRESAAPEAPTVLVNGISEKYFAVTGTRILSGRTFSPNEIRAGEAVAIISQSTARALFKNENPIGRRIAVANQTPLEWREIVGVVENVRPGDIIRKPIDCQVYEPISYDHWYFAEGKVAPIQIAIRSAHVPPESLVKSVRETIAALDRDLPIRELMTANAMIERFSAQAILFKYLLGGFAVVGVFLAGLGIYGVLARIVAQRTGEIGIRMALGATVSDTVQLILGMGLKLAVSGAIFGLVFSAILTRILTSVLPGLQASSGLVIGACVIALTVVALIACFLPARNAASVDPAIALRAD
jgi:predicted permease